MGGAVLELETELKRGLTEAGWRVILVGEGEPPRPMALYAEALESTCAVRLHLPGIAYAAELLARGEPIRGMEELAFLRGHAGGARMIADALRFAALLHETLHLIGEELVGVAVVPAKLRPPVERLQRSALTGSRTGEILIRQTVARVLQGLVGPES